MNIKMVLRILGTTLIIEAGLLFCPLIVGIIYRENSFSDYLIPMAILLAVGIPLACLRPKTKAIYAKEGFVTVALVWILMSLAGALPFVLSGAIPNYIDALFETVSGLSTTGASILTDVEVLSKSILFWRSFTHWIGGMGVLVFVLAIMPGFGSGIMHVFRAESPGPSVGKLVSKLTFTARILYGIYILLTFLETIFLLTGGMSFYDSIVHAFSTAGTGGFGIKNSSIAYYDSVYIEMIIAVFMFLFSINFNLFYLLLIGNFKKVLKSEELMTYLIIVISSTLIIALNILSTVENFGQAIRYSFFQVTSISSTTGFSTADFNQWPALSKSILVFLMVVGACGGSTGGGIKVSRMLIMFKTVAADIKRLIHPRSIVSTKIEGELLEKETQRNVYTYLSLWVIIVVACTVLLSIDVNDFLTNFTATLACIGNIGPGLNFVGPMGNYAIYSPYSKLLLSFVMLVGRLEIFPMLIMFAPRTWKRG